MRVAAHHLHELVFAMDQCFVVDAARVHLSEPELAPLRDEAQGAVDEAIVVLVLVLVADARRSAIDDDRGALDRFFRGPAHLQALVLELLNHRLVGAEERSPVHQVPDLGSLGGQGSALVKGDFLDAEFFAEVCQQADQWLADGACANDVDMASLGH